ncbi:MAG: cysteine desulfurase [Armatimonadetes bacterium]|nr:cysteine desulfurase [Armatimonadota bacterium]
MKPIYLDNAATTPLDSEALRAMRPYFRQKFGNPSSIHPFGSDARQALDRARETIARHIGADYSEIVFTSGGTESINTALLGVSLARQPRGNHIVTLPTEHHAVLEVCAYLERRGFEVSYLPVDPCGRVSPDAVRDAVTEKTVLISIAHANNETGTLQPIADIARIAEERGICFHTDAVQSIGILPVNAARMGVGMLSASAHKFHGPKGAGFLYIRKSIEIYPLLRGGPQERNHRAGTENVPAIVGMAKALERSAAARAEAETCMRGLRDRLWNGIRDRITGAHLHGHPLERLPGHLNIRFDGVSGQTLLIGLALEGVAASAGAACASGALLPSHVLTAMGLPPEEAMNAVRLTPGRQNTLREIDSAIRIIERCVRRIRRCSKRA